MNLVLKIDQDANYTFFSEYDKLGALERKIWQAAVWWVKRFPCAYPKQSKIADHVGCSRKHVNRAFAKFKIFGWIYLTSRGARRTKIIGIPTHLFVMNVAKREYFKKVEVTSKVTHSSPRFSKITGGTGEVKKSPLVIPKLAQKLGYSQDSGRKLALLPEYILEETLYQSKKLGRSGFRPDNEEKYFVGMAFKIAYKNGIKPKWKKYYTNRGKP